MTSELRPAVEVWDDIDKAFNSASIKGSPILSEMVSLGNQAAAAVIEADREAVRAEQAAELAKFKALAETLAGALPDDIDLFRIIRAAGRSNAAKAQAVHARLSEALRQYEEAANV